MHCKYFVGGLLLVFTMATLSFGSRNLTVSLDGGAAYQSIQAAVNAAQAGDTITILDTSIYSEQVTIDSTKNGLVVRSCAAAGKPRISFKDTVHVHPLSCEESQAEYIDYDQNGALRLLQCKHVTIDGIVIDGGTTYSFGGTSVWGEGGHCMWPMQHGNAAIVLNNTGGTIIRNCDISNAFFGIYIKDRNLGGLNALPKTDEVDYWKCAPGKAFGKSGNHVIEYNRIHHNSWGIAFEAAWDLGSVIRYNLIYENHHRDKAFALVVKNLTSEGSNMPGGAIYFKDYLLAPLAIYNNTFWHNFLLFAGGWRPGNHYLMFNNIYAKPNQYWMQDSVFSSPFQELDPAFINRMHNSVYAFQGQKPMYAKYLVTEFDSLAGKYAVDTIDYLNPSYVMNKFNIKTGSVTVPILMSNGTTVYKTVTGIALEGNPIIGGPSSAALPDDADIRWLETKFASTDPGSSGFLVPDWNDSLVNAVIKDKGWQASGVADFDATPADLGAMASSGLKSPSLLITPLEPAKIAGTEATLRFSIDLHGATLNNMSIKYLRLVLIRKPDPDGFGGNIKTLPAGDIVDIPLPTSVIVEGENSLALSVPQLDATVQYAFIEMFCAGTTGDNRQVSGFGAFPYRKIPDTISSSCPAYMAAGTRASVFLKGEGKYANGTFREMKLAFVSGTAILDTMDLPLSKVVSFPYCYQWEIVVGIIPPQNSDTLVISGLWYENGNSTPEVINRKAAISFGNGAVTRLTFTTPPSNRLPDAPLVVKSDTVINGCIQVTNRYGTMVDDWRYVVLSVSDSTRASFDSASMIIAQNDSAFVPFPHPLKGSQGESVKLFALLTNRIDSIDLSNPNNLLDTATIRFGSGYDRLYISYPDSTNDTSRISVFTGSRIRCVLSAGVEVNKVSATRSNTVSLHTLSADTLLFYDSKTGANPVSSIKLVAGKAEFWISSKKVCSNAGFSCIDTADNSLLPACRYGLYFLEAPVHSFPDYRLNSPVIVNIDVFSLAGKLVKTFSAGIRYPFLRRDVYRSINRTCAPGMYLVKVKPQNAGNGISPAIFKVLVEH